MGNYEHERIAFLDEETHDRIAKELAEMAIDLGADDKTSYFFPLAGQNISIAVAEEGAKVKFKNGQIGQGLGAGYEELEAQLLTTDEAESAVKIFNLLTGVKPQVSHQFRRNYMLDGVEIALKYTETWGFHAELECVYDEDTEAARKAADERIMRVIKSLGAMVASDEELLAFRKEFERSGKPRGQYSPDTFRSLYSSLQKLAALKRLPEQQSMDTVTAAWIAAKPPEVLTDNCKLELGAHETRILSALSMPENWFITPRRKQSMHGQLHLARVGALAAHLARQSGYDEKTATSLFVAGLLHDIARRNDQNDTDHGQRSATWYTSNKSEVLRTLQLKAEQIDDELITSSIAAHDTEQIKGAAQSILRKADALDRYRMPKLSWRIDDEKLGEHTTVEQRSLAYNLVKLTEMHSATYADLPAATRLIIGIGA